MGHTSFINYAGIKCADRSIQCAATTSTLLPFFKPPVLVAIDAPHKSSSMWVPADLFKTAIYHLSSSDRLTDRQTDSRIDSYSVSQSVSRWVNHSVSWAIAILLQFFFSERRWPLQLFLSEGRLRTWTFLLRLKHWDLNRSILKIAKGKKSLKVIIKLNLSSRL